MPLNPLHMVKAVRRALKTRRLKREIKAAISIQAAARGYLCRYALYRALLAPDLPPEQEDESIKKKPRKSHIS